MSNVKIGDLAWWMVSDGPWPVCTIIKRAGQFSQWRDTTGRGWTDIAPPGSTAIAWYCQFPRPVYVGMLPQFNETLLSDYFPIDDRNLKRITGPGADRETDTNETTTESKEDHAA